MNKHVLDDKEVLDLLNYVNIDDDENCEECLKMDDLKKKKLKKNLLKKVKGKNKIRKYKYGVAAAAVASVIFIGIASPAFAKNIPILNSIIQAINGDRFDHGEYQKYSQVINRSKTSNGITFTINEVVCDDTTFMIGYTIKSKENIKKVIKKEGRNATFGLIESLKINGKEADSGSVQSGKYLDDYTYVSSESINIGNKNFGDLLKVDLDLNNIYGIKGDWNFKFSASKKDMIKNTKIFKPNIKAELPYADINVEKVSISPINTTILVKGNYNKAYKNSEKMKEESHEYSLFLLDDKGNEVTSKGMSMNSSENLRPYDFYEEHRFVSINKNMPKYLTVIPYMIDYRNAPGYRAPIRKDINGIYPIELSQGNMGKIIINEINTDKDKTIVRYRVEGKATFLQADRLFIVDDKDNVVDSHFIAKKSKNSDNDYTMEFEPLDKNKKYQIGTNNLDDYKVRNDFKFRIDLSK